MGTEHWEYVKKEQPTCNTVKICLFSRKEFGAIEQWGRKKE